MYRVQQGVLALTQNLPVGTNKRIHDALLTIMRGGLLKSRGAIIPALDEMKLDKKAVLRTREAIAGGSWSVRGLLKQLWGWMDSQSDWQPLVVAGYRVNAMDTTCIYRPRLKNCDSKHYNCSAGKALAAINFGLVSAVGRIGQQKITIPRWIIRGDQKAKNEEELMKDLALKASAVLSETDLTVADRKFPVIIMLEADLKNLVVRRASNFTVRRRYSPPNTLSIPGTPPPQKAGRGRPRSKGELIRPLARVYQGKTLAASIPDAIQTWQQTVGVGPETRVLNMEARIWRDVVMVEQTAWSERHKALNAQQSWVVCVLKHPDYEVPMVVLLNLDLTAQQTNTVMHGRWGVEQLPLVSKQLLGLHRMFVHQSEMRFRLPELGFVAASLLMVMAASCEPMPSGWWDTQPKPTAGRLRRVLGKVCDLSLLYVPAQLREKHSVTSHLPPGYHPAIPIGRAKVPQT